MRKRNWHQYNTALVKRGSLTFYIDQSLLKNTRIKTGGRPRIFGNPLLQILLFLKIQYSLSYRALEGFSKSILVLFEKHLVLPSYSMICRRAKEIATTLPKLSSRRPSVILLDSSGFKVYGEGEWKVKMHGKTKRRKWIKLHLSIDETSQEIVGARITEGSKADCKEGKALIEASSKRVREVKADGAYDTRTIRECIEERGGRALIPPKKNAVWSDSSHGRGKSAAEMKGFGYDKIGKSLWGKLTGYSKRSLAETAFSRLKKLFGSNFFSREEVRQGVEGHLKCVMMNKMLQAFR